MSILLQVILGVMLVSALMGFVRVVRGPAISDRIVAASSISVIFTMMLVMVGFLSGSPFFLDVALAFAVLLFADVLLMAKYFEHGELHE